EDERKGLAVLDAEHDRAGEPRWVDAHMRDVAALACDRLEQEASEPVVADARDESRLEPEARATERGVGGGAAEILGEARHVLETGPDLLRVEVDREAAEADDVQCAAGGEVGAVPHRMFNCRCSSQAAPCPRLGSGRATALRGRVWSGNSVAVRRATQIPLV